MTDDPFLLTLTPTTLDLGGFAALALLLLMSTSPALSQPRADALEAAGLRVENKIPCAGICPMVAAVDAQGRVIVGQMDWYDGRETGHGFLDIGNEAVPRVSGLLEWLRPVAARRVELICPLAPPGNAPVVWRIDGRFQRLSICSYDQAAPGAAQPETGRAQ